MKIIEYDDVIEPLMDYYKSGGGNTYYLGFRNLAKHYSIKEGGVTDWTGYPGSGKTELLLECLVNTADWYGHRHLIHMPDAGSVEEVIGKLIHKLSGQQFEKFYYDKQGNKIEIENRIKEKDIYRYLHDVLEYFKILDPEQAKNISSKNSKALTPKEFWDFAVKSKEELGIFSAVIDSWNYMRHDTEGFSREDKWLEATLSYRNDLSELSGLHFHTIIHPKSTKVDKDGKILMPSMHSLKGGSEWGNNGKTIIVVHRDWESKITDIKVDKAKPHIVGVRGTCCLQYDLQIGKYFELVDSEGGRKKYAEKEDYQEPLKVKTNTQFLAETPIDYSMPFTQQDDDEEDPF